MLYLYDLATVALPSRSGHGGVTWRVHLFAEDYQSLRLVFVANFLRICMTSLSRIQRMHGFMSSSCRTKPFSGRFAPRASSVEVALRRPKTSTVQVGAVMCCVLSPLLAKHFKRCSGSTFDKFVEEVISWLDVCAPFRNRFQSLLCSQSVRFSPRRGVIKGKLQMRGA